MLEFFESEEKSQEKELREQFDNYIELWLQKTSMPTDRDTGIFLHGLIDGMYLIMAGMLQQSELPTLTKVRQEVQRDYAKMYSCPIIFKQL